jgi:tRNA A-37 threonylcarbamoyl transferase component Bud32
MLPHAGDILGDCRILDEIGSGGMARVYRAEQLPLGREVAVKVLAAGTADDEAFRQRFLSEGRHLARLNHANIVDIHTFGESDGRLFLVMQLVRGTTLADRLHAGWLSADETHSLLTPIAAALDYAHEHGVIHRDVKPHNILIEESGHPYLADFGIAKSLAIDDSTAGRGFVGSYAYAAPEQIKRSEITAATDIYALTAVAFQCLTGTLPYERDEEGAVLSAHLTEPRPKVSVDCEPAARFNEIVATGMARDPRERYATAAELMSEINMALAALPTERRGGRAFRADRLPSGRAPDAETVASGTDMPDGSRSGVATDGDRARELTRSGREGRRRAVVLGRAGGVAVLVAGLLGVGYFLTDNMAGARQLWARSSPFKIAYSAPWRAVDATVTGSDLLASGQSAHAGRTGSAPRPHGIALRSRTLTLVAGWLASSSPVPGGVPAALVKRYGSPRAADVTLAGHAARLYTWTRGAGFVDAFVVPAPRGDAAIICTGPSGGVKACSSLAHRARISAATIAPGRDRDLAARLSDLADGASLQNALVSSASGTLRSRADATKMAATEASHDAAAVRRLSAPARYRPVLTSITSALVAKAKLLDKLAAAARANDAASYVRHGKELTTAGQHFASALHALARYQIKVAAPGVLHVAPPPASHHSAVASSSNAAGPVVLGPTPTTSTPSPPVGSSTPPANTSTGSSAGSSTHHTNPATGDTGSGQRGRQTGTGTGSGRGGQQTTTSTGAGQGGRQTTTGTGTGVQTSTEATPVQ